MLSTTFTTLFDPFIKPGDCLLLMDSTGKKAKYTVTAVRCGHDFVTMEVEPKRFRLTMPWVLAGCGVAFAAGLVASFLF